MTRRTLVCVIAGCGMLLLGVGWIASNEIREAYAFGDEKISLPGVPNAGRVAARLYRGGQPTAAGFASLKALGVTTVVSFTLEGDGARDEEARVESLGMRYVHFPWSASRTPPAEYVNQFVDMASGADANTVIFAHCKAGADRTGLMIAAYRIRVDKWTAADALAEMDAFGYESEFQPHLRRIVEQLAQFRSVRQ